ncbi:MAG: hypothetical protein V3W34_18820 [Phycisphaerae bacterium]
MPQSDPGHIANNLRVIRGTRAYLIKASQAIVLTVRGKPSGSTTRWKQGFTLNGFHVVDPAESPPTFTAYLEASSAFDGTEIFQVQPNGTLTSVAASSQITAGRGYWVKSGADVTYDGPIAIDNGSLRGIVYARSRLQHSMTFRNLTTSPRDITLTAASSAGAAVDTPDVAGDVPLRWLDYGAGGKVEDIFQWRPLISETYPLAAAGEAGARRVLRVSVRRAGLSTATVDPDDGAVSQYQSVLVVTDGLGFRRVLPLSAEVLPVVGPAGAAEAREGGGIAPHAGLYLGSVTVDRVSWVTAGSRIWTNDDPNDPDLIGNPDDKYGVAAADGERDTVSAYRPPQRGRGVQTAYGRDAPLSAGRSGDAPGDPSHPRRVCVGHAAVPTAGVRPIAGRQHYRRRTVRLACQHRRLRV